MQTVMNLILIFFTSFLSMRFLLAAQVECFDNCLATFCFKTSRFYNDAVGSFGIGEPPVGAGVRREVPRTAVVAHHVRVSIGIDAAG